MNIYNSLTNYNTILIAKNNISFKGEDSTDSRIFTKLNDINDDLEALKLIRNFSSISVRKNMFDNVLDTSLLTTASFYGRL